MPDRTVVRDLYISRIGLSIFAAAKCVDRSRESINLSQPMNVGIGTEAAHFLFQEHINSIFGTVWARGSQLQHQQKGWSS
jgi:hypothetical protein